MEETQNVNRGPSIFSRLSAIIMILIAFLCLGTGVIAGFLVGANMDNSEKDDAKPTPLPSLPLVDTPTPSPLISPTPDQSVYKDWQEYIVGNCGIKLFLRDEWQPSRSGEQDTCNIFRLKTDNRATDIESYRGVMFLIVEFGNNSIYSLGDDETKTVKDYLELLESKSPNVVDSLLSKQEYFIDGKKLTYAHIDRANLGKSHHVFYSSGNKEYMIIWGGLETQDNAEEIQQILAGIKFL